MCNQSTFIYEKDYLEYLKTCCYSHSDNRLFILLNNVICSIDVQTGKYQKCCTVSNGYGQEPWFFRGFLCLDNKLYLHKADMSELFVYDLCDQKGKEYHWEKTYDSMPMNYMMEVSNEWVMVISRLLDVIVLVSRKTDSIIVLNDIRERILSSLKDKGYEFGYIRYMDSFNEGDLLWLNVNVGNKDIFIKISIPACVIIEVIDPNLKGEVFGIYLYDGYLYFQHRYENTNRVIKYNLELRDIEKAFPINAKRKTRGDIYGVEENLVLALRGGQIYKLNRLTDSFELSEDHGFVRANENDVGELLVMKKEGLYLLNINDDTQKVLPSSLLKMFLVAIAE